jgi:diguanylate cyclase (GGDEF)-like protein
VISASVLLGGLIIAAALLVRSRRSDAHLAYVDALTRVGNRRRFDRDLEDALDAARAGAHPVALAMVDLDDFKQLNDTYGHPAGDDVLRRVAATIGASIRAGDVVYRYGGEEFCVLLSAATRDEAAVIAERIRARIESTPIPIDGGLTVAVTASVGLAGAANEDSRSLLAAADRALYAAKDGGRNRVVAIAR